MTETALDDVRATPPSSDSTPRRDRMPGLDGLRALAVLGVIFYHLKWVPAIDRSNFWHALANRGGHGVQVFFVLSGFLITWLLLKEESKTGGISLYRFYVRRGLRILPPALVYLGVVALLGAAGALTVTGGELLASALFFRNYATAGTSITVHYWTLSVEEQFYLIWPLLVILLSPRFRLPLAIALLAATPFVQAAYHATLNVGDPVNIWRFEMCYDMLLVGCLLALLRASTRWSSLLRSGFLQSRWALLIAAALWLFRWSPQVLQSGGMLALAGQIAGSIGVAMAINYVIEDHGTLFEKFLSLPPIAWIGRLSYSLYLWQQLTCFARPGGWWINGFPQCILFAIAAAACSYYLIEQPVLRLRDRFMKSSRTASTTAH